MRDQRSWWSSWWTTQWFKQTAWNITKIFLKSIWSNKMPRQAQVVRLPNQANKLSNMLQRNLQAQFLKPKRASITTKALQPAIQQLIVLQIRALKQQVRSNRIDGSRKSLSMTLYHGKWKLLCTLWTTWEFFWVIHLLKPLFWRLWKKINSSSSTKAWPSRTHSARRLLTRMMATKMLRIVAQVDCQNKS